MFSIIRKYKHLNLTFIDQALVSGVNFLTGILFARFLGLEEFGRYTLIWMAVLFINSIQSALICAPMMSIGPKQSTDKIPCYYGAVSVQQLFFASVSFVCLFAGVKLSVRMYPSWAISNLAIPLAFVIFFFQNQDFLRRQFYARNKPFTAFLNDIISYLGQFLILIYLFVVIDIKVDTAIVLWVIAGTSAVACIVGLTQLGEIRFDENSFWRILKRHWLFSRWLVASSLLQWTSGNLIFVITGSILGPVQVGAMRAAQNIMGVSHVLFQALENIVPVKASRHLQLSGQTAMLRYIWKTTLIGGLITGLIAIIAGSLPELWLTLLYGEEYQEYGYILRWFAIIYLFMFLGFPLRFFLRTMEKTKPILFSVALSSVISIFLAPLLIKSLQLNGAMLGLLIVYSSVALVLGYAIRREIIGHNE